MIKGTFYFETDNFTWTETLYKDGSGLNGLQTQTWQNFVNARVDMLGYRAALVNFRFVDTAVPRVSLLTGVGAGVQSVSSVYLGGTNVGSFTDRPYSSVCVQFYASGGFAKRTYFSGVPDGLVNEQLVASRGYDSTFAPKWSGLLQTFCNNAAADGWGWLRRSYLNPPIPISGISAVVGPNGELGIITQQQLVFQQNVISVMIKGFRRNNPRMPGLAGVYRVDQTPPGYPPAGPPYTYYLRGTSATWGANLGGQGAVSPLLYALTHFLAPGALTQYSILLATHRKRGGSALLSRGRSRTRA